MGVKYYDFKSIYSRYSNAIKTELDVISNISEDPDFEGYLKKFEKDFANFVGTKYAIGVSSGTAGLQFSLIASGIKEGDEVITTSNTYIATALAIRNIGAIPIFIDINPQSFNIDTNLIEGRITTKTKAIVPVHLYGHPCNMKIISEIAKKHNLQVIEDACQAHGASIDNHKIGSIGNAGCFSFYTYKVIGGMGNGGIVTTNSEEIYKKIKSLRDPESNCNLTLQSKRTPCYLDFPQIAMIKQQLADIDWIIKKRNQNADIYDKLLSDVDIILLNRPENTKHSLHSYVIRTNKRNDLKNYLKKNSIETEIEYPTPIHKTNIFKTTSTLPITEKISDQILSLPIHEHLTDDKIVFVANKIKEFFNT